MTVALDPTASAGVPASGLDASDDFVAEGEGFPQGEGTHGAVPVVMKIRTADAAVRVSHQNLSRFGRCCG